jgi:hypothetical protein
VAPVGRPVHAEAGHGQRCARLARDQAADDEDRRSRMPPLVTWTEAGSGALRRHRLARRITDWCPRCGWYGYFDGWAATIKSDWARLVCDNCWADLHQGVTVTVAYYTCSAGPGRGPFAVIRQLRRSDQEPPAAGQVLTWEPFWQWTPILDGQAGDDGCHVTQVSRAAAEQAAWSLASRQWPAEALRMPWVTSAYPS